MSHTKYICLVCPKGCHISLSVRPDGPAFTGWGCIEGKKYAESEYTAPKRVLTSTVAVENGLLRRLPVVTAAEIPKSKLKECLAALYKIKVKAPVKCGDIVYRDLCGTGVDLLAARSLEEIPREE